MLEDKEFTNKLELTSGWVHITRFDYERTAEIIENSIGIIREDVYLGFAGTYSESCVKKYLLSLCKDKIIPEVKRDYLINLDIKSINNKFGKGKLIYELTENPYVSLLFEN